MQKPGTQKKDPVDFCVVAQRLLVTVVGDDAAILIVVIGRSVFNVWFRLLDGFDQLFRLKIFLLPHPENTPLIPFVYSWPHVLLVWICMLYSCPINNRFTCSVKPKPVKHEVSHTVILPLMKSSFFNDHWTQDNQTNLNFLQIPKGLLHFQQEDENFVILLTFRVTDDGAQGPIDSVLDAQTVD